MQGNTPSPYEAAAQLKKKHATKEVGNGQDWRWQVNKRQKVPPPFLFTFRPLLMFAIFPEALMMSAGLPFLVTFVSCTYI